MLEGDATDTAAIRRATNSTAIQPKAFDSRWKATEYTRNIIKVMKDTRN